MREDTNKYIEWLKENMKVKKVPHKHANVYYYTIQVTNKYVFAFQRATSGDYVIKRDRKMLHNNFKSIYRLIKQHRLLDKIEKEVDDWFKMKMHKKLEQHEKYVLELLKKEQKELFSCIKGGL